MTILLQGSEHFKTLPMINTPYIVKKKLQGAIPHGNPDLALPKKAGLQNYHVGDRSVVRPLGRILRKAKMILDEVLKIKVGLCILDLSKLGGFSSSERSHRGGGSQKRRRDSGCRGRWRCRQNNPRRGPPHQEGGSRRPERHGDIKRRRRRRNLMRQSQRMQPDAGTCGYPPRGRGVTPTKAGARGYPPWGGGAAHASPQNTNTKKEPPPECHPER